MSKHHELYTEFRSKHPNLKKLTVGHNPYGKNAIIIYLKGGEQMVYDGELQRAWFIKH